MGRILAPALEAAVSDPTYRTVGLSVQARAASWLHRWALSTGRRNHVVPNEPEVRACVLKEAGVNYA